MSAYRCTTYHFEAREKKELLELEDAALAVVEQWQEGETDRIAIGIDPLETDRTAIGTDTLARLRVAVKKWQMLTGGTE